ncbi:MAG: PHP domain-containing protein [Nitrospinota bacterium]|nr:PHP domain-containing protein [Nitrospinota bacterium]
MPARKSEIHMHSNFSDGELSPTSLVEMALQKNVSILSLTDHDTFRGIGELIEAAESTEITAFPGIEITVSYRDFNIHLLGYFKNIDSISAELWSRVEAMQQQREDRMVQLIAKINKVIPGPFQGSLQMDNVKKASEGVLGRPHLAREMVRLKIVADFYEAFEKYLSPYNIEKENLSAEEAIRLIRCSGGIPVVAHPGERQYSLYSPANGRDFEEVPGMVEELKLFGLLGLECVYPYHEKSGTVDYFLDLADRAGLIATGSRDFHGFRAPQRNNFGTTPIDDSFLDRFQAAWG